MNHYDKVCNFLLTINRIVSVLHHLPILYEFLTVSDNAIGLSLPVNIITPLVLAFYYLIILSKLLVKTQVGRSHLCITRSSMQRPRTGFSIHDEANFHPDSCHGSRQLPLHIASPFSLTSPRLQNLGLMRSLKT